MARELTSSLSGPRTPGGNVGPSFDCIVALSFGELEATGCKEVLAQSRNGLLAYPYSRHTNGPVLTGKLVRVPSATCHSTSEIPGTNWPYPNSG